jgi:hypothetical protein
VTDVLSARRVVLVAAAALAAAASLVAAPGASAATCWERVISDWRDGHISGTYSAACFRAALRHLPEDLRIYGSAEEDITRALTRAVAAAPHGVLAATATRTKPEAKTAAARPAVSSPARKATRSLSGRQASKSPPVVVAAPAENAGGGSALTPARTAVAAAVLGLVALAVAAVAWRTRRRRARRAL